MKTFEFFELFESFDFFDFFELLPGVFWCCLIMQPASHTPSSQASLAAATRQAWVSQSAFWEYGDLFLFQFLLLSTCWCYLKRGPYGHTAPIEARLSTAITQAWDIQRTGLSQPGSQQGVERLGDFLGYSSWNSPLNSVIILKKFLTEFEFLMEVPIDFSKKSRNSLWNSLKNPKPFIMKFPMAALENS